MNRDQAKQLLPIIQAFADGKTIDFYSECNAQWEPVSNPIFSHMPERYRIKPETVKVKYRRFIFKDGGLIQVLTIHTDVGVKRTEDWDKFVRWVDHDWITEEVEINNND